MEKKGGGGGGLLGPGPGPPSSPPTFRKTHSNELPGSHPAWILRGLDVVMRVPKSVAALLF